MQVVEGYQVGNTERQLMAPTLVAMASNLRVMASIQNRHQRCTSFLAPDVTLSVCGNGSFGTLRRCLGTTCHLSEVPALSLLGAPGLTTRNKDATRDSCVFFLHNLSQVPVPLCRSSQCDWLDSISVPCVPSQGVQLILFRWDLTSVLVMMALQNMVSKEQYLAYSKVCFLVAFLLL